MIFLTNVGFDTTFSHLHPCRSNLIVSKKITLGGTMKYHKEYTKKSFKKKLDNDKFRIIKIGREALWEFIYESMIDHQEQFFGIKGTGFTSHFDINYETGDFIFLINNDEKYPLSLPDEIDLQKLLEKMDNTTTTLFAKNRYVELTLQEIEEIQGKE